MNKVGLPVGVRGYLRGYMADMPQSRKYQRQGTALYYALCIALALAAAIIMLGYDPHIDSRVTINNEMQHRGNRDLFILREARNSGAVLNQVGETRQ